MRSLIKLEELLMLLASLFAFTFLDLSWWWFVGFILAPDISMIGYLVNSKVGAWCYNFFHHRGIALVVAITGYVMTNNWIIFAGIILFGHASLDRMLGYGLKYEKGFKFTHLGEIGKSAA